MATSKPEKLPDSSEMSINAKNDGELQRGQGLISLIALGVGAVISGDFFGWNYGLDRAGFGGLIISTIIVGFMYICVSLSLAELAAMYPSAEGAFAFSRRAFGPYAGFMCGLSESLEYVLLVPVIITGLGDHLNILFGISNVDIQIVWWIVLSIIYLILHLYGPRTTFWSNIIITALSVLTLFIYWCVSLSIIGNDGNDVINDRIYNIVPDPAYSSNNFLPNGVYGVFTSLVFSSWFFIAVEELPLAGEDAINPTKNIPRALIGSIIILMFTAFLTAFFSVSLPGGSYNISITGAPLVRSLISGLMDECVNYNDPSNSISSNGTTAADICNNADNCYFNEDELTCWDNKLSSTATAWEVVIDIGTLIGLLTSCHAIIFAGGRQLMSLTRNGTFPSFTGFDKITNGTPRIALIFDIILSFFISLIVYGIGEGVDFLVGLSVAAACISYILSMCSFIKLRLYNKDIIRPYKSPLGIYGAAYAVFVSFLVAISFFVDISGAGPVLITVVICLFVLIYAALSFEFLFGCGLKKSGKQRFEQYEKNMLKIKEKDENDENNEIEIVNDENDENDDDEPKAPNTPNENTQLTKK